ncbi:putative isomerase YbhE [Xylariaceae sp. FL1651]|nr:putative isomerase YbhE [Xylariaceae sp. FL1651]
MLRKTLTVLLTIASMATATPFNMRRQSTTHKLTIGGPAQILTADFDGSSFSITSKNVTTGSIPSWLRFKVHTSNTLYAVNENGSDINVFAIDPTTGGNLTYVTSANGSSGVVFLEFNTDQTRMVGAAYGSGMIDVWDLTATNSTPKILKQIEVGGPLGPGQAGHHPHQALLDPTRRFMIVPDLGGDQLLVLDTQDDKYEITSNVSLPAGSGPRHGGFIVADNRTFYTVACEPSSMVVLYQLTYTDSGLVLTHISTQSTYGALFPPANATSAAAGELVVASNNKDVYISNRLSGNETDSIAHFVFDADKTALNFVNTVSSGGLLPRHMSLSIDDAQSLMFVANQGGNSGLAAFSRCHVTGKLSAEPIATKPNADLVAPGLEGQPNMGPQFVQEI